MQARRSTPGEPDEVNRLADMIHDGMDLIGEGRHERIVVTWNRFNAKVAEKAKAAAELVN